MPSKLLSRFDKRRHSLPRRRRSSNSGKHPEGPEISAECYRVNTVVTVKGAKYKVESVRRKNGKFYRRWRKVVKNGPGIRRRSSRDNAKAKKKKQTPAATATAQKKKDRATGKKKTKKADHSPFHIEGVVNEAILRLASVEL